jgi:hypothetical protein
MGEPAYLKYQNPAATDANLDVTIVDPGSTTGIPTVRENMQIFTSPESRQLQETSFLQGIDAAAHSQVRRQTEHISLVDRRGGTGRGSTR